MNIERLSLLRDHLRNPAPDQPAFNMANWFTHGERLVGTADWVRTLAQNHTCGTAACAAGTTIWLFNDVETKAFDVDDAAAEILGLNDNQAYRLFFAMWASDGRPLSQITAEEVAEQIDLMIAQAS